MQINAVKIMLSSFNAKDIKEYMIISPQSEILKLVFTFSNKNDAKNYHDFIIDRTKYWNRGISSFLTPDLLQPGKLLKLPNSL